ncbi:Peptidoglycan-recognition protein LB [Gryllus bimaculatus]|nr:Peptidoglycan-recognition protein LB [Gryllus bimaculatus]
MATAARATQRACALLCALALTLASALPTTTQRAEAEPTTERILLNSIESQSADAVVSLVKDGSSSSADGISCDVMVEVVAVVLKVVVVSDVDVGGGVSGSGDEGVCLACAGAAGAGEGGCPALVGRAAWGAAPPRQVERQEGPALLAVVHHTYVPGACNSSAACEAAMRAMQRFHQEERGWNDIGYNFVVGGDGRVYEGRGWGVVGAHALHYNLRSVGVSLIGDYVEAAPPAHMTALAQRLLACGARRGALAADYSLLGHRQVRNTQCPGDAFYAQLSAWPHWVARLDPALDATVRANATTTTTTPSPT